MDGLHPKRHAGGRAPVLLMQRQLKYVRPLHIFIVIRQTMLSLSFS